MKAYIIDEISPSDMEKIKGFLRGDFIKSGMDKVFWVPLPDHLLTGAQAEHADCLPLVFAVELGSDWIKFEFFLRTLKRMRCTCPGYCTEAQKDYVMKLADDLLDKLAIQT